MGLTPEAANGYEEFFVPAIFDQWPPIMITAAAVSEGDDALDVGCGTGLLTRELTRNVGDTGGATGFDLSESMLGVARNRCPEATFKQGNVSEMWRVLRPSGRLVISVWQGLENNVVYRDLVEATREVAGDDSADSMAWPFTMGQAGRLEGIFKSAGTGDVVISEYDGNASFPSVEDFVATEI